MAFIICAAIPGGRSEAEAHPPPGLAVASDDHYIIFR